MLINFSTESDETTVETRPCRILTPFASFYVLDLVNSDYIVDSNSWSDRIRKSEILLK